LHDGRRRDELVPRNPFIGVRLPKDGPVERRFITGAEALAIEQAMDPWWALTIPVMFDTAVRIGELCALRVCDVTFGPSPSVHVRRGVTETSGYYKVGTPKTHAGTRVIPTLTVETGERLATMVSERGLAGEDLLFRGLRGGPMRPLAYRARIFRPAVQASGIDDWERVTPHSFRHGAVAAWVAAGITDGYKISRYLGHGTPTSAYRLYGHLLPNDESEVTAKLSAARAKAEAELAGMG